MSVKTLEVCSLMPVESDIWFINQFTDRDYTIRVSKMSCQECGCTQYAYNHRENIYESYCNNCGLIREREGYINEGVYNGFTHDMKVLKNRSTHLKTIETQIIRIEPDYNKKYRDFKHRYYKLFISIANNDYHIDKSTANDLFYNYFRGFYDLNNRRGLKRTKLVRRFLDRISVNPREYFMTQAPLKLQKKVLGKDYFIGGYPLTMEVQHEYKESAGHSRIPVISEGQLNVTDKQFNGRRISYQVFLKVNNYPNTTNIMFKYIKRYCKDYTLIRENTNFTPFDWFSSIIRFNPTIWDINSSVAKPVTPIPVLNKYIPYKSLGLKDMIINTVQYPSRSKYQGLDTMKDNMIQELKKKQPYYSTNLNNYTYTNKPEKKQLEVKKVNDSQKNTENKTETKTINGTLMTKKMNEQPYRDKTYNKPIGKRRKCHNCGQIFITSKHRQLYCSHCKHIKHNNNTS